MLELFTLGTIADLAPLTGVNRHWVKSGLQQLPKSKLAGVQALIQVSGVQASQGQGEESIQNTLREATLQASTKSKIQIQNLSSLRILAFGWVRELMQLVGLLTHKLL
jgi:single-stranded-DNA-specific exonuclease